MGRYKKYIKGKGGYNTCVICHIRLARDVWMGGCVCNSCRKEKRDAENRRARESRMKATNV